ncbi:hypothetical protein CDQ84_08360 [Clostridium thermosuccinogenes]|uniref:ABC transmembrane type-1 domain-containing protein n=1 Tax=Clostridium thermosuccinogenes TaxID=84032 RepID=A0A2K2FL18_9CLOT|nr:sugar ABC transporter permease [Pseudoclostridium thermosuccinogenes]AUS97574.1 hypothetical protein CDO33_14655 [Pseudoclostridium thermosuccinogenes]PNT97438.1 hypothetical protein CDQ85_08205 [Pseudoclostridium thermosuccinogenes]PNT99470.1 hypothetical protein CDQ84_08360 [Pseudoclostridium thermosuccinogenes]
MKIIKSRRRSEPIERQYKKRDNTLDFIAPFLIIFITFMAYPSIYSIIVSFTKYRAGKFSFAGLSNFRYIDRPHLQESNRKYFFHTDISGSDSNLSGSSTANFLNIRRIKALGLFRMFIFMPVLIFSCCSREIS